MTDGDNNQEDTTMHDDTETMVASSSDAEDEMQPDIPDDSGVDGDLEEQSDDDRTPTLESPSSPTLSMRTDDSEVDAEERSERIRYWQSTEDSVSQASINSYLRQETPRLTNGNIGGGCHASEGEEKEKRTEDESAAEGDSYGNR
jgi:hypothetical protein